MAAVLANPKAILFYMGMLPGFFDVTRLTWPDIAVILGVAVTIPLALLMGRARAFLSSPGAERRTNVTAGTCASARAS